MRRPATSNKPRSDPDNEPNFYAMDSMPDFLDKQLHDTSPPLMGTTAGHKKELDQALPITALKRKTLGINKTTSADLKISTSQVSESLQCIQQHRPFVLPQDFSLPRNKPQNHPLLVNKAIQIPRTSENQNWQPLKPQLPIENSINHVLMSQEAARMRMQLPPSQSTLFAVAQATQDKAIMRHKSYESSILYALNKKREDMRALAKEEHLLFLELREAARRRAEEEHCCRLMLKAQGLRVPSGSTCGPVPPPYSGQQTLARGMNCLYNGQMTSGLMQQRNTKKLVPQGSLVFPTPETMEGAIDPLLLAMHLKNSHKNNPLRGELGDHRRDGLLEISEYCRVRRAGLTAAAAGASTEAKLPPQLALL